MRKKVYEKYLPDTLDERNAGRLSDEIPMIVKASKIDDGLLVSVFDRAYRFERKKPILSVIFAEGTYFSIRYDSGAPKGSHACITNLMWSIVGYGWEEKIYVAEGETKQLLEEKFGKENSKNDKLTDGYNSLLPVIAYQNRILKKKKEKRHEKKRKAIENKMKTFRDLPASFYRWMTDTGMKDTQYLFYRNIGKREAECSCGMCGETFTVDRNETQGKHNKLGVCPKCGAKIKYKAFAKVPRHRLTDRRYFLYPEIKKDRIRCRYVLYIRKYYFDEFRREDTIYECLRTITEIKKEGFGNEEMFEVNGRTWKTTLKRYISALDACRMYPAGLDRKLAGTDMKYIGLGKFAKDLVREDYAWERAIGYARKQPKTEWLIKCNLKTLAKYYLGGSWIRWMVNDCLDENATGIKKFLKLDANGLALARKIDAGPDELRSLQLIREKGLRISEKDFMMHHRMFGAKVQKKLYETDLHGLTVKQLLKYMRQEKVKEGEYNDFFEDWTKYVDWCLSMGKDLHNQFHLLPNNFKAVHDRTAEEYKEFCSNEKEETKKKRDALIKERMNLITEFLQDGKKSILDEVSTKNLVIMLPESGDEIKREGENLHHCVGNYVRTVAEGKTVILFIRKRESPEESYYTMEWDGTEIVQCRGYRNCGMTDEVKDICNRFKECIDRKRGHAA